VFEIVCLGKNSLWFSRIGKSIRKIVKQNSSSINFYLYRL